MKNIEKHGAGIFTGAGYLIGFLIGAVAGILMVKLTGIHGLIGATAEVVAIPAGYMLERQFQRKAPSRRGALIRYILFILSGVILFFVCFFIVK